MEKTCIICKILFKKSYTCSQKEWFNRKYCSRKCKGKDDSKRLLGNIYGFKKGIASWNKGLKGYQAGENNPAWKGDKVGYVSIHCWVRYHKGSPQKCEQCGTIKAKRYEWANISLQYKRNLNDYRRLCVSCHRKEGFAREEYKLWNKGKKFSKETRFKMSLAKKGRPSPMLGKKHSKQTREKMRQTYLKNLIFQ